MDGLSRISDGGIPNLPARFSGSTSPGSDVVATTSSAAIVSPTFTTTSPLSGNRLSFRTIEWEVTLSPGVYACATDPPFFQLKTTENYEIQHGLA